MPENARLTLSKTAAGFALLLGVLLAFTAFDNRTVGVTPASQVAVGICAVLLTLAAFGLWLNRRFGAVVAVVAAVATVAFRFLSEVPLVYPVLVGVVVVAGMALRSWRDLE